jgi:hypothetical protein
MRFTEPAKYSKRTVTKFLWWPRTMLILSGESDQGYNAATGKFDIELPVYIGQTRWLERATWEQSYTSKGRSFPYQWEDGTMWRQP